jgi:2-polyprenyl-6-methoxyphenol hydroxylase-like FAD-dependent oxidoreductase
VDIRGNGAQVVIVGAGPTGVMLAIELARRGVEVSILDKQPERSRESRAIAIHARTLELFHQLGFVDEFLDLGHRVDGFTFHTRRRGAISVDVGGLDSPYPFILMLSQAETHRLLEERLETLGVRVQRGVKIVDLHERDDWVELHTRGREREDEQVLRADWVVGCDGAHSLVRSALGVRF